MSFLRICQIAPLGSTPEWVLLGRDYYGANRLVLLVSDASEFLEIAETIKSQVEGVGAETIPDTLRTTVAIEVIADREPVAFVQRVKEIILREYSAEQEILVNATSGPRMWQLLLYYAAAQLPDKIKALYVFEKDLGRPQEIWLPVSLSQPGQRICDILREGPAALSELVDKYKERYKKGTKGLISNYLGELAEKEIVAKEEHEGQIRFRLTARGQTIV